MSRLGTLRSVLFDAFRNVSTQYPAPTDGDSVYVKDVDITHSDNGNFTGSVSDYFDDLKSANSDATASNPKSIKVWFNRTVYSSAIGLGCDNLAKGFGTSITVKLLGSGEVVRETINHTTMNPNSTLVEIGSTAFNGFILEFNTSSEVCLSNITIRKEVETRSQIKALKDNGEVTNIGATNNNNLRVSVQEYGDTAAVDAFARLRVSENYTIFDSKQLHDSQPLFWDEEIGGSATSVHSSANAETLMTVTASASDYVIRQTKQRFNYQPGKSQLSFFTFLCDCADGLTKRVGQFDGTGTNNLTPNNGIFFQTSGTSLTDISWNIAKNGTTTETATQPTWNVDSLDGTGPSGITLDLTATQIGVIDFEWLGVGRVRVGFVIDGLIYYCHYFNHANNSTYDSVYMSTPNLPVRYDIQSDGTGSGSFSHICSTVISEGGIEETGIQRAVGTGAAYIPSLANGTAYAIIGIRLKTTHLDTTVIPKGLSVAIGTNDSFRWQIQINPTLAASLTYGDLANSSVQYGIGSIANVVNTDGLVIGEGFGSTSARGTEDDLQTALRIGSTISGVRDELVLVITPLSANMSVAASLDFRELL